MKKQKPKAGEAGAWVVLVGMSGAGKTALGKALAKKTGAPFVDVDECVCKNTQSSAPDFFKRFGEAAWRKEEHSALVAALSVSGAVVVVGAGAPGHPPSMQALLQARDQGVLCAWIDESDEVIAQRLGKDTSRPLLSDAVDLTAAIARQRLVRQAGYAQLATVRLGGSGVSPGESVDAAERMLVRRAP